MYLELDTPAGLWRLGSEHPDVFGFARQFLAGFAPSACPRTVSGADMQIRRARTRWQLVQGGEVQELDETDLLPAVDLALRQHMMTWLQKENVLHAAVIGRKDAALLVAGSSGAGKSTLAVAWHVHGGLTWGDEYARLRTRGTALQVVLWPRPWEINHHCDDALLIQADNKLTRFGYPLRDAEGQRMVASYYQPAAWPAPALLRGTVFLTGEAGEPGQVEDPGSLLDAWLGGTLAREFEPLYKLPQWVLGRQKPSKMVDSIEHILTQLV